MKVKVWNDNKYPFSQEVKGNFYKIPAKEFIEVEEDEASQLVKSFSPIIVGGDSRPLPESYKMLRIDKDDLKRNRDHRQNKAKSGSYICQACGYVASNKWELNGHTMDMHKHQLDDLDEAAESIAEDTKHKKKRKVNI
jgi:hypothetical protein